VADGSTYTPPERGFVYPQIHMEVGLPHKWIAESIASLRADQDLFTRDTDLVHVTRITEDESAATEWTDIKGRKRRALPAGGPKIHTMTLATLRVRMARWAAWTKTNKEGDIVATEPLKDHAEAVRDEKNWPGLRRLDGVSETPFPRPDLSLVQVPGWDRATRYLYEPSARFHPVSDAPDRHDAIAARLVLEDLYSDFPFAAPCGVSGAIALLLTLLYRPAIMGPVPAWIVDATTPGTGKSLLADVCAGVALGRDAGRAHFPATTGRESDAELGKRLGMFARMGLPLICFDNADEAVIGSDVLEEVVSTPNLYTFRVLGKSEGLTLPVRFVVAVTANNASWSRGMNRRILHVRLESPFADPEKRPIDSYRHPERAGRLLDYAIENRGRYVHAALTILRAYAAAQCPEPVKLGTFEAWAALVPSAIVWAGGADPMLCRPGADGEETPDTAQRATLAREWTAWCVASGVDDATAHTIIERVYPRLEPGQPQDPKWDAFRGAIEYFAPPRNPGQAPDPARLADALRRRLKGAPVRTHDAPAPLRRFVTEGKSGGRARWKVVDVEAYTVHTQPTKEPPT
jgi:hypothetical protein